MKDAILIIGSSLKLNEPMMDYIYETYKSCFDEVGDTFFSTHTNANLPFLIDKLIQEYEKLTIFAQKESFILTNKILSTITEDSLVLKDDMLLPSLVNIFEKNSYMININECFINVLLVQENEKLPKILHLKESHKATLFLLGFDEDSSSILLDAIKQTSEINTTLATIVDGLLMIQASAKPHGNINEFCKNASELFRGKIFIAKNICEHIVSRLVLHDKTISFSESCTGGLLSALLTKTSGASKAFGGSLVTYSNHIKNIWLGVNSTILDTYGAVSEECVKEMLNGTLNTSSADYAIAISGIAGPDGGSVNKPVGTIYIGAASKEGKFLVQRMLLKGDRHYIQTQSAYLAFKLLLELDSEVFL